MPGHDLDGLSDAPWYVRAFVRVGLPTAAAAGLMWFVLHDVGRTLDAQQVAAQQMVIAISHMADNDRTIVDNQHIIIATQNSMVALLQDHTHESSILNAYVVCISSASTESERRYCANAMLRR